MPEFTAYATVNMSLALRFHGADQEILSPGSDGHVREDRDRAGGAGAGDHHRAGIHPVQVDPAGLPAGQWTGRAGGEGGYVEVPAAEAGMIFYSVKAVPEYLPLLKHHVPAQPALPSIIRRRRCAKGAIRNDYVIPASNEST